MTVKDLNDCTPVFVDEPYLGSVLENSADGTEIALPIAVTDCDVSDEFSGAEFSPLQTDGPFAIDSVTGVISVSAPSEEERPDFERAQNYTFNVKVFDGQSEHGIVIHF